MRRHGKEEEEQSKEDRDVQKIVDQGTAVKRKILTGNYLSIYVCMCVKMVKMV